MPPVKLLPDQTKLVETSEFPSYAKFPFKTFNPVQSRVLDVYDKDANVIIAAATSAGKTVCAEMMMSHEVRMRGGKAMYLAPLRALAKEKIDDWTDKSHHFGDLHLSICTGDYRLTPERRKELEAANQILMTSEMLNSRCRNFKSEQNNWLKDVGTLVVDEAHLLTVPGRGDHLEVGLMKFSQITPNARIVFLSATMPNVKQLAEWVSYSLTQKDTYLIDSKFRPCPLGIHYETYYDRGSYDDKELEKVNSALQIVMEYPDDKFLVFVHTKRTGQLMKKWLTEAGIKCEYHNADLEKEKRHKVEKAFREDKDMRVIVATSTLAWGLNMPARRVVILGVHRGLNLVESYDIWQMAGRAGRVGLDPRGDVYVLLPDSEEELHRARVSKKRNIESTLLTYTGDEDNPHYKTLAFHLVSEIHHGGVKTKDDIHHWYEKSLAHWQANDLGDDIVDRTLELLLKCGAIYEEGEDYKCSTVGVISSMFYYSPFDVSDLKRNFKILFEANLQDNDIFVSLALGNVDTFKGGIVSRLEREEMSTFATKINQYVKTNPPKDAAIKAAYAYFTLLRGMNPQVFAGMARNLQFDFPRTNAVLQAVDSMAGKWGRKDWLKTLQLRIAYGVRAELVHFCRIPNIGRVRAEKLWRAGFRDLQDIGQNVNKVQQALGYKQEKAEEICAEARKLALVL